MYQCVTNKKTEEFILKILTLQILKTYKGENCQIRFSVLKHLFGQYQIKSFDIQYHFMLNEFKMQTVTLTKVVEKLQFLSLSNKPCFTNLSNIFNDYPLFVHLVLKVFGSSGEDYRHLMKIQFPNF